MSPRIVDFYTVLQVAPDAEREVIEAAYRQLMRKYHPDRAAGDEVMAAQLTVRAKQINQAYAVLRDEHQRRTYDRMRGQPTGARPAPPPPPHTPSSEPPSAPRAEPWKTAVADFESAFERPESAFWSALSGPAKAVASAYYLLPGPYEWEPGARREFLSTSLILPLGVLAWLATTGRLSPWLGRSPYALAAVLLAIGLVFLVTQWNALPRLIVAGGSTLLLMSGLLAPNLRTTGVPDWFAWATLGVISLLVAARPYVFGVLPTVGMCWLVSHVT